MRGKGRHSSGERLPHWITPAYAGKSIGKPSAATTTQDHPRLCGEKLHIQIHSARLAGSPPPMRGKASRVAADTMIDGITPAYAGKSQKDQTTVFP